MAVLLVISVVVMVVVVVVVIDVVVVVVLVVMKEGNVLFNDALNTLYLRLYGVGHMVKNHSDSETRCRHMG